MRLFGDKAEDLKHIIRHKYMPETFKPERIEELGHLIADPANMLVFYVSKKHDKSVLPLYYKWYKMNYSS